jgi:hypothetical protein
MGGSPRLWKEVAILKEEAFAGKQVACTAIENPQMRGFLVTPIGTVLDIDTLPRFRKRPKRSGLIPDYAIRPVQTAQTAQPE